MDVLFTYYIHYVARKRKWSEKSFKYFHSTKTWPFITWVILLLKNGKDTFKFSFSPHHQCKSKPYVYMLHIRYSKYYYLYENYSAWSFHNQKLQKYLEKFQIFLNFYVRSCSRRLEHGLQKLRKFEFILYFSYTCMSFVIK